MVAAIVLVLASPPPCGRSELRGSTECADQALAKGVRSTSREDR